MTTHRSAPYRHTDGSNCWTNNCSRNKTSNGVASNVKNSLVKNDSAVSESSRKTLNCAATGAELMEKFSFSSVLTGGFAMEKVQAVVNADASEFSWSKPSGGVWLATIDEYGSDSWNELLGVEENEAAASRQEFALTSNAKVIVIRSEADYQELLDNYPYYPDAKDSSMTADIASIYGSSVWSIFNQDNTVRRNVNYSKLSQDYDAVLLTWQGLGPHKRNFSNYSSTDVSLYTWDIESMFVMNPSILTVK